MKMTNRVVESAPFRINYHLSSGVRRGRAIKFFNLCWTLLEVGKRTRVQLCLTDFFDIRAIRPSTKNGT